MTPAELWRAAPKGMLIAVAIAFALLNGLGIWQVQRLRWKEGLINDLAHAQALPPAPVNEVITTPQPAWREVILPPCDIKPDGLLYMHSEMDGQVGYRVLATCDGLLVDLGFSADKLALSPVTLTPVGRLRPYDKANPFTPPNSPQANDWYWRSAADMGPALHASLRPDYFVVLDLQQTQAHIDGLKQGLLTASLPNRHLEYAITWFSLAWIMLGMFVMFVIGRVRGKPSVINT